LCDDWTAKILRELEKDRNAAVQSSRPRQQNLQARINDMDDKVSKLIDMYLEGSISLEEYQRKKEFFINEKKTLQESARDFAAGGAHWFEPAKDFVTLLNSGHCAIQGGNLESQKEFLEKIGSNFILKERRLNFSAEASLRPLLEAAPCLNWRVVVDESRTLQPLEIPLLIKIHRKRSMGWLIALDEPIFNKPTKTKEPINSEPYYDYVI